MENIQLKHPPLVEAILEIRWALESGADPQVQKDPGYSLLLGKLHDKICGDYPHHEVLPAAAVPDEISGYVVKHRFRSAPNSWPLVQVGPGILTVNETKKYTTFKDFRPRAISVFEKLFECYPEPGSLRIKSLHFRYIDAIEFDYSQKNIWQFIEDKLGVPIALPDTLFSKAIIPQPKHFAWQSSFACSEPKGTATLGFATGVKDRKPALIWDQMVQSVDSDIPAMPEKFEAWIDSAHTILHDWFFKLIAGNLKKEFNSD